MRLVGALTDAEAREVAGRIPGGFRAMDAFWFRGTITEDLRGSWGPSNQHASTLGAVEWALGQAREGSEAVPAEADLIALRDYVALAGPRGPVTGWAAL